MQRRKSRTVECLQKDWLTRSASICGELLLADEWIDHSTAELLSASAIEMLNDIAKEKSILTSFDGKLSAQIRSIW